MKRLLALAFLCAGLAHAEGPLFRHKDSRTQQEFENVYQGIRTVLGRSGSSRCIYEPTLCIDSVNERVGVGTASPSVKFHVIDDTLGATAIFDSTGGRGASVSIRKGGSSIGAMGVSGSIEGNSTANLGLFAESSLIFYSGGSITQKWLMDTSGAVTQPLQPSFIAYLDTSTENVTGDGTGVTIVFNAEIRDPGADFNTANGVFTAPVAGCYSLGAILRLAGLGAGHNSFQFSLVTTNYIYQSIQPVDSTKTAIQMAAISIPCARMDANDTAYVSLQVDTTGKTVDVTGTSTAANIRTWFSGSLIN